ncbi:MAG TPA: ATP-dependent DNA ligase [Gaiellales bacterium]|jgi:DNA ligase-1|nr:ATP-dependent DNA ligase [Gaiellales bacterium]
MLFAELAATSEAVRETSSRRAKVDLLAGVIRSLEADEVAAAVAFLSGRLRQRQPGVGWASLRDLPTPAATASLEITEVDGAFERLAALAGSGSQAERRTALAELFGQATAPEQAHLRGLIAGELRQGAQEGVMVDAVARAADLEPSSVRRAQMLRGDLGEVARVALADGAEGLARFRLQVGRPLLPMLAQTASDIAAGMERLGTAAVEWKLDGVRVQIHRADDHVTVYTRTLDDITDRVPELVAAAMTLPVTSAVLDGEAIAIGDDGRPLPFQVTSSRIGGRKDVAALRQRIPLAVVLFDALHLDGRDLLDEPGEHRFQALRDAVPEPLLVPHEVIGDVAAAQAFLDDAITRGHEGVVLKALDQPYRAGRREAGWLKVKPVYTLDLVILAVEWGHGRRSGYLSNLHLGARDPAGGFVMLGKTFKGLTDEMLAWQTERLLELEDHRDRHTVHVQPELVVEVAFDGVQRSSRYPGGVALRFARVKGYRTDKRAADADTIEAVRALSPAARG